MFGLGRSIGHQAKQITYNVYEYYKKRKMRKDTEEHLNDINLVVKVADVTGISRHSIVNILKEARKMKLKNGCVNFKPKDKGKRKKKIIYDYIVEGIIRRKAIEHASLRKLHEVLQKENILSCSIETLRRILHKLGFTSSQNSPLTETTETPSERQNYLKTLKYFREQERPIFYLSETKRWKCMSHNEDSQLPEIEEMPSYVMICSSGPLGFLDKANSMVKMKPQSDRFEHFENYDWIKDIVLRNLPPKSVIVMNIPYCETPESITQDVKPTDTSRNSLEDWLKRHNIQFNEDDTDSALSELIYSQDLKMEYSISKILKESGHDVLYLPENHHDLDPAAIMWQDIKNGPEKERNVLVAIKMIKNYSVEKLEECFDYVKSNEDKYISFMNE